MSNHFKRLHPYVCQRLISLFEKLSKKLNKALSQLQQNHSVNGVDHSDKSSEPDVNDSQSLSSDLLHDLSIYEEVLRMVLEIINACLTAQLTHNPNLVYQLLYKRQVFEPFQTHPSFQDIVMNIETVLTYFSNRIEGTERSLSVAEVYDIIRQSSLQWPTDRLKVLNSIKFIHAERFLMRIKLIFNSFYRNFPNCVSGT